MTEERKSSLSTSRPKKAASRAEATSERPRRSSVAGRRGKLEVQGLDRDMFEYRWVKDAGNEQQAPDGTLHFVPGQRIVQFLDDGWVFVKRDEVGTIGETQVYSGSGMGDIIRQAAGMDEYLFLMKIKKDWYEEDQQAKEQEIREREQQQTAVNSEDGQYGSVSIGFNK